ncbi:histidine kinase [Galbibacter sp. EGI 63066]|uniref:histidine kinase n=1 Tax=Galbibacter sp. EGI 63066 TaxID=2993559 RepID=UPI00224922EF|nr:histidine kinase [Galbibacter sp. EGI 63066]MCX2678445.1 histidine kinase [Galbibacter sp. EGI 63066]
MQPHRTHKVFSNKRFEEILLHFSVSTLKKETEEELLWDVAKNCISQLNLVDCVIYLLDAKRGVLMQKAAYGPKNPKDYRVYNPIEIPLGKGISGHVAKIGKAKIIKDTRKEPLYITDDDVRLSEIAVPFVIENRVIGVIDCEHPEQDFFTDQHLRILTGIANLCAVSIQNLRVNNRIREEQKKRFLLQKEFLDLKIRVLSNQLNPHFVFNTLNAIQHFILSEKKTTALRYLTTFSRLVRFYLGHLGSDTVALNSEVKMLGHYLSLQNMRYQGKFSFKIIPKTIDNTAGIIPAFVLQPLLENLIENTPSNTPKGFKIQLYIKSKPNTVLIKIEAGSYFSIKNNLQNNPKYRTQMLKWQDQIRLMNRIKGYNIKKKAVLNGNQNTILIELPNLKASTT